MPNPAPIDGLVDSQAMATASLGSLAPGLTRANHSTTLAIDSYPRATRSVTRTTDTLPRTWHLTYRQSTANFLPATESIARVIDSQHARFTTDLSRITCSVCSIHPRSNSCQINHRSAPGGRGEGGGGPIGRRRFDLPGWAPAATFFVPSGESNVSSCKTRAPTSGPATPRPPFAPAAGMADTSDRPDPHAAPA
jgi:hypothetical protein